MLAEEHLSHNKGKSHQVTKKKAVRRRSKDLTLTQQLAAYGQHLHERPQLLVLGEQLGQVLTAEKEKH